MLKFKIFFFICFLFLTACKGKDPTSSRKKGVDRHKETEEGKPTSLTKVKTSDTSSDELKPVGSLGNKLEDKKPKKVGKAGSADPVAFQEKVVTSKPTPKLDVDKPKPADTAAVVSGEKVVFDFCAFPDSLKKAIKKQLNMNCASVTLSHLAEIKQLKIENLNEQESKSLTKNYASYFPSLEDLDVSENLQMLSLPSFVAHLLPLNRLNVSKTGISDFNESICNLKKLTTLIAHYNNYKGQEVPMAVFCLSTLKVLDMSHSSIRYIDEYIYKLKNLEKLYMRGNRLMIVPFMLQTMSNLFLVDLRDNIFTPPSSLAYLFAGYRPLNALHTCEIVESSSRDRQSCQEDMLSNFECKWWHKVPFKRGYPFRRYKEMTENEFRAFTAQGQLPSKNRCYLYWLNTKYVPFTDSEKAAYLEHTINGKTIREWRVVFPTMKELWGQWYGFKTFLSYCGQSMLSADTSYGPDDHEIFPEQYYSGKWDTFPKDCEQDRYLYE